MVDKFTFLSLALTPAVLLMCFMVIRHWGPASVYAIKSGQMDANDWLILGIVIGFAGALGDNFYWALAWHYDYIGSPSAKWLFEHGSVPNVFMRQGAGILSGLCHVVSAYMLARSHTTKRVLIVMLSCVMLGLVYAGFLVLGPNLR